MTNIIGQDIGRYHILEQLGQGGMATVYKAFDTRLEREVAIKLIRMEAFGSAVAERMLKRFEREGKSLAKLMHPNIVPIHDYGEYNGSPYLVMAYIPGGTLKYLTGNPMPYPQAARFIAKVAHALAYAHSLNIIHRDIKPANILITSSGQPMLSDFGVAKILDNDEGNTLTGIGVGVGTPEYMAPEQWLNKVVAQTDIYSLGVVFYELVTGQKPYSADTPAAILIKQTNDPLPRPKQYIPDLPDQVEQVIFKALAKKPEDRFASMSEFAAAMEKLAVQQDSTAIPILKESGIAVQKISSDSTWDDSQTIYSPANIAKQRRIPSLAYFLLGGFLLALLVVGGILSAEKKISSVTPLLSPEIPTISSTILNKPTADNSLQVSKVNQASILYKEDFESGNISEWVDTNNDGMWQVYNIDGNNTFGLQNQSPDYIPSYFLEKSASWKDYSFETDVIFKTGRLEQIYLVARSHGQCSGYLVGGNRYGLTIFRLDQKSTCQGNTLAEKTDFPLVSDRRYKLKVEVVGQEIRFFVDGELVLEAKDDVYPSGGIVLSAYEVENAYFDNIIVTDLTKGQSSLQLIFDAEFESSILTDFRPRQGIWSIVDDGTGNKVLQNINSSTRDFPRVEFGPRLFSDGVIEYRFRYVDMDPTIKDSGIEYIFFRTSGDYGDSYALQCGYQWSGGGLNYVPENGSNWPDLSSFHNNFQKNQWYFVKIEAIGNHFKVLFDNQLIIDTFDSESRLESGRLGFQTGPKSTVQFDDVKVWQTNP